MKSLILTEQLQQAVIEGHKTQTRRIVKANGRIAEALNEEVFRKFVIENEAQYKVGEVIYLREWFRVHSDLDKVPPRSIIAGPVEYKLGGTTNCIGDHIQSPGRWRWHQTMPAHLARTFLKVTDVRVERLRNISDQDAIAEGVEKFKSGFYRFYHNGGIGAAVDSAFISFKSLWQSLYGEESWKANPWVFAYTFERCDKNGKELSL